MADSRYDNIRYYSDGSFKVPKQIKVYNGNSWLDLGEKNSYSTKKLNVRNGNNFLCATYYRHDVNIPKTIQVAWNKYMNLNNSNGNRLPVDNWHGGYAIDMHVEVYDSTPLYTCYTRNQGDIVNQSYNNYVAEVSGNAVRLRVTSHFSGYRITDGKYVNGTTTRYTGYVWSKGEKVRILLSRSTNGGYLNVKVYNPSGTLLCDDNFPENTQWVYNPNIHRLGSETTDNAGSQSTYGNAKIHSFSMNHPDMGVTFTTNFNNAGNGSTTIWSSGTMGGYVECSGTSVYGASYSEYIRQTI